MQSLLASGEPTQLEGRQWPRVISMRSCEIVAFRKDVNTESDGSSVGNYYQATTGEDTAD
jgi:hypothetical protein